MKDKIIKEILTNFDFNRVYEVMKFLNWTWLKSDKSPSHYELIEFATDLLNSAYDEKSTIASGGFRATYFDEKNMSLSFIINEFWTEND